MADANSLKTGLTRRGFLKAAGVSAGAFGLVGAAGMTTTDGWLAPSKADAASEERIGYTFHQGHCSGHCSLKCTVRDNRLCLIEPNDAPGYDKRYRTVCARGISEIEHVYGAERIQTPLKRVGDRGSGEFIAITWDEALAEIKEKLGQVWAHYGNDAVVVGASGEASSRYPNLASLLKAQGLGNGGIDVGVGNGLGPMIGDAYSYVMSTSEARDWTRSKTIILAGTNFLESSLTSAKTLFEAKEAGAYIVSVDSQYSTTAGKVNQWVSIEPGTDAALFLGMISCILDNKWYDEDSMKTGTSFPFLVDAATGVMLRQNSEGATPSQTGAENPYMVWDLSSSSVVPYLDAVNPALEGEYEVNGRKYTTSFELLKASQTKNGFTLDWASKKTTVEKAVIEDLARRYALDTPSTLGLGWGGADKYMNADICGHAAGTLAALTGNYGKPGASIGVHIGGAWTGWSATLASWELPSEYVAAEQEMPSYSMRYKENSVHALISLGDLLQQHYANMSVTTKWLESLDFILQVDMYHTEGINWADIVLPACTKFETTEDVEAVKVAYGHLLSQGKVLDPLFESKTDSEIERLLAKTMGVAQDAIPKTAYEYCDYQISQSADPKLEGMSLKKLIDNQGVLPLPGISEIREAYSTQIENTLSGRFDVYQEMRLEAGQALPVYEDPDEVYSESEKRSQYPLQLSQTRTKFQIHNQFWDAAWLKEFYQPHLQMNPIDMELRSLADGDVVEIFNDRSQVQVPVRSSETVRPNTVRVFEGIWTKYMTEGNVQALTNDKLSSRDAILNAGTATPFQDTLVEVRKA